MKAPGKARTHSIEFASGGPKSGGARSMVWRSFTTCRATWFGSGSRDPRPTCSTMVRRRPIWSRNSRHG